MKKLLQLKTTELFWEKDHVKKTKELNEKRY